MWLFDPVFVDDDGQAYMYFGGNGQNNIRVIKLGNDMISTVGSAMTMSAPRFSRQHICISIMENIIFPMPAISLKVHLRLNI